MNTLTAVFGIALLAALLYTALKRSVPSYALFLSLAAALVILVRVGAVFRSVVRSAVIFLLTDYTRTLCEEAGADSLAWCVGLAGRCLVLAAAWPLLEEILQRIGSMTG